MSVLGSARCVLSLKNFFLVFRLNFGKFIQVEAYPDLCTFSAYLLELGVSRNSRIVKRKIMAALGNALTLDDSLTWMWINNGKKKFDFIEFRWMRSVISLYTRSIKSVSLIIQLMYLVPLDLKVDRLEKTKTIFLPKIGVFSKRFLLSKWFNYIYSFIIWFGCDFLF